MSIPDALTPPRAKWSGGGGDGKQKLVAAELPEFCLVGRYVNNVQMCGRNEEGGGDENEHFRAWTKNSTYLLYLGT